MPYTHEGPPLVSGPPERVGKTARQNTADILQLKYLPCFYNNKRAWMVLGYGRTKANPKPSFFEFKNEMRHFWAHHARHDKTRKGRKARALILDALRVLGIRSLWWNSSMKGLNISGHDGTYDLDKITPGEGNYGKDNSHEYQRLPMPTCYQQEHHSAGDFEILQWQKYHRYQGFYVPDRNPEDMTLPDGSPKYEARLFCAIPMPEGPDSLWYALSYHTGGKRDGDPSIEGPYISSPWVTKMRIWTYFVQTLKEYDHERWKDYHILQSWSAREVEGFGECSLLRSLYAGRDQGRPAYSAWPSGINYDAIFHVVADYFATQVIVFAIDARLPEVNEETGIEYDEDEDREVGYREQPHILPYRSQANRGYQYRAYGRLREGEYKQILLATNDWKHFDAVDWDQPAHLKPCYYPANWPDNLMERKIPRIEGPPPKNFPLLTAEERLTFQRPFEVDPIRIRKIPAPWWRERHNNTPDLQPPFWVLDDKNRPPCRQARYNRIERHCLPRDENNILVWEIERPIDLREHNDISGPMPNVPMGASEHHNETDTLLDDEICRHFLAHHDIPGWSFKMPSDSDIDLWLVPHQRLIYERDTERRPRNPKLLKGKESSPELGENGTPEAQAGSGDPPKTPKTPRVKPPSLLPLGTPAPRLTQTPGTVARYIVEQPYYKSDGPRFYTTDEPLNKRYQIRFGPPKYKADGKVDAEQGAENLSLIGCPEIQFGDVADLRWS